MQHDPSTATAHTAPWKNQGSLGFSTWQRHARLGLTEGGRGDLGTLENQSGGSNDRGAFRAVYERHASFAEGLIARSQPLDVSVADSGRFMHAPPITRLQRYSYLTASPAQPHPAATTAPQRPYHGLFHSANQRSVTGTGEVNPARTQAGSEVRSQPESKAISRATGSGRNSPAPLLGDNRGDGPGMHRLPFSSSAGRDAQLGSQAAAIPPSKGRIPGEGSIGLRRSFIGSAIDSSIGFPPGLPGPAADPSADSASGSPVSSSASSSESRIKGGAALPIGDQRSSTLMTLPLIIRSSVPPGIAHRSAHSGERIRWSYEQANVQPGSNTAAGSAFDTGLSRHIRSDEQNLQPGHVEREGSGHPLQRTSGGMLPLIPLVTGAGSISRSDAYTGTAPIGQRQRISDRFSPAVSSSFSQSNRAMRDGIPTTPGTANKIFRKQAIDGMPKIDSSSQDFRGSMRESLPMVRGADTASAGSSSSFISLSVAEASERFNESRKASTNDGEATRSISRALRRMADTSYSSSHALPLAPAEGREIARPGLTASARDSIALTHSTTALSSSMAEDDRSGIALDSIQDGGVNTLPYSIKRIQRVRSPIVLPARLAKDGKGSGEYPESGRYEAGSLPAVQRLLNKTSPIGAHRRTTAPQQLSISSVHLPPVRGMVGLSPPSEPALQKKPVSPMSLPTARLRPLDPPVIPEAIRIARRTGTSPGEPASFRSINHRINYSGPPIAEIADRSVSATATDCRSNSLSPAFLPLSMPAGIARSGGIQPAAARSTDTGSEINPADIGSAAVDSAGNELTYSLPTVIARSLDIDALDIAANLPPHRGSISLSRSRRIPVASSDAAGPPDHGQGSLRLKPFGLAPSFDRAMRTMTNRLTGYQSPSMSAGHDISTSGSLNHCNASSAAMHSISGSRPNGVSGSDERPLVILQRTQETALQAPVQKDAAPAAPESVEDQYRLLSPPGQAANTTAHTGEGNKAQQPAGQIDTEEIAERVWRIMAERLVIEQERRGLAKWP